MYKTSNGGLNWNYLDSNGLVSNIYLQFTNEQTGYSTNDGSIITKTTNGGISWYVTNNSTGLLITPNFFNNDIGLYVDINNHIFRTSNGGLNWSLVESNNNTGLSNINYLTNNVVIISRSPGKLMKSSNMGLDWSTVNMESSYEFTNMKYVNDTIAYLSSTLNLKKSTDAGIHWIELPKPSGMRNLSGYNFFENNFGYCYGYEGQIATTYNDGLSWINSTDFIGQTFSDMFFVNSNTGFLSGKEGLLFKTTNGGISFNKIDTFSNNGLNSVYFINSTTGFVGGNLFFLRTTNGGNNWISVSTGKNLTNVHFINSLTGFAISLEYNPPFNTAKDVKTIDGGNTWFDIPITTLGKMYYLDQSNYIYPVSSGSNTSIYKTSDEGQNWILLSTVSDPSLSKLSFINSQKGFAFGTNGVYKTVNGGLNWAKISNFSLYGDIYFTNENTGYMSGYKSTNGGVNWFYQSNSEGNKSVFFGDIGIRISISGTYILKTTDGGGVGISSFENEVVKDYVLYQNYPNPFNPNTKINFDLKNSGFTRLIVLDITGREVQTLLNEKLTEGTYSFNFDGRDLPSGVYFYQLQTQGFVETKKMILLK